MRTATVAGQRHRQDVKLQYDTCAYYCNVGLDSEGFSADSNRVSAEHAARVLLHRSVQ